jgi:serine-type D-Ala-D-Ala carboxypeptidase (penicillin-binding protein 5/6)
VAVAALTVAFLVIASAQRIAAQGAPALLAKRTLPASVRIAGSRPSFAWPREGQAAAEVLGVGLVGTSGRQESVPIASVAKIMTAYLTLLEHPLQVDQQGFTITISSANVSEQQQRVALGQSTVSVEAGEHLSERQALEALMLPSANNIAELLAEHSSGGRDAFIARMNATARTLGMRRTRYTDPSGYDDRTVSSASDQLKLTARAMRNPTFAAIVNSRYVWLPVAGTVNNYNGLIGNDGYVGVKTGSDRAAGGCFAFAKRVEVGGRRLTVLGVVLGQREGPVIEAALNAGQSLGDSIAAALRQHTVVPAHTAAFTVQGSDGRSTSALTSATLRAVGWGGLELPVRVHAHGSLTHVAAGQSLGSVAVGYAAGSTTDALAAHAVGGPSLGWRLTHLL